MKKRVSYTTLYAYVDKLQDTLTVFFLDRFSESVYLRRSWPKKVYVCDTGIPTIMRFSEKAGDRMENAVFLDLKRRQNEEPLLELYYWKDRQGREVDFLIREGQRVRQLIQVVYASAMDEVESRELKGLVRASELLGCKDLLVITWDLEDEMKYEGRKVRFMPLWKWLLEVQANSSGYDDNWNTVEVG